MSNLAATRKMMSSPPPTTATHLYGSVGEGTVQALMRMGVSSSTLEELNRHATNAGVSLSNVWTVAFQYIKDNGIQIFQIILNLLQKLSTGGFSLATIQALYQEDGGKYKDLIASLLVALGKEVPPFLATT